MAKKLPISGAPPTPEELDSAAEKAISRTADIEEKTGQNEPPEPGLLTRLITSKESSSSEPAELPIGDYAADPNSNDPITIPSTIGSKARSIVDFLVGPEMAVLGFKWENEHYAWSLQNSAEQWAEEPLWSSLAAVNLAVTAIPPIAASLKFGRLGMALGKGFKYTEPLRLGTAAERFDPLLAKVEDSFRWFEKFRPGSKEEIKAFVNLGYLEPDAEVTASTLRKMRSKLYHVNDRQVTVHRVMAQSKYESELNAVSARIAEDSGATEITSDITAQATSELISREIKPVEFGTFELMKIKFDKYFANRYFERVNDVSPDGLTGRVLNENLAKHTKDMRFSKFSEDMDTLDLNSKEFGKKIWQETISRAAAKRGIAVKMGRSTPMNPVESKFFTGLYDSMSDLQSKMIDEHFLHPETMHDPVHIAALRKRGIAIPTLTGIGSQTSFSHMMGHSSLLPRKSDLQELYNVSEQGGFHADTFSNIVSSHVADDMLFFNMQTVRDLLVASTDDSGKMAARLGFVRKDIEGTDVNLLRDFTIVSHKDIVESFKSEHRIPKNYVSLDEMFHQLNQSGSDIGMYGAAALRRMLLHPAKGKEALVTIEEGGRQRLPWVSKQFADMLFGQTGLFQQGEAVTAGLMEVLTTMYKINKTAFNPASHTQNILGNVALMSQAGFNVLSPTNLALLKDTTDAFKHIHNAHQTVRAAFNSPNRLLSTKP